MGDTTEETQESLSSLQSMSLNDEGEPSQDHSNKNSDRPKGLTLFPEFLLFIDF